MLRAAIEEAAGKASGDKKGSRVRVRGKEDDEASFPFTPYPDPFLLFVPLLRDLAFGFFFLLAALASGVGVL